MNDRIPIVCDHPFIQAKLAVLRDASTPHEAFRVVLEETAALMGYEALRSARTRRTTVSTPLGPSPALVLDQPVALVAVLRAGLGLISGLLRVAPEARVGHVGLYRDEETLKPVRYYVRLPEDISGSLVVLCDPMLATGGSAVEALRIVKAAGARQVALLSLIASRPGVRRVHEAHPDVTIFAAAVDPLLTRSGYISPGLGDAGDRLFGTMARAAVAGSRFC